MCQIRPRRPRAILRLALLTAIALARPDVASAENYPVCGIHDARLSIDDPAEEFFILSAQEGEKQAAASFSRTAEEKPEQAVRYQRLSALASERAIADLAAAAKLLEERGQLRLARTARALKDRHRESAEASWAKVESLGGHAQRGGGESGHACSERHLEDPEPWRRQAERQFRTAEEVLGRSEPPYSDQQVTQWAVLVALGADALVLAGCARDDEGIPDLLEASRCYLAAASNPGPEAEAGDLYAQAASALRAIAPLRSASEQ